MKRSNIEVHGFAQGYERSTWHMLVVKNDAAVPACNPSAKVHGQSVQALSQGDHLCGRCQQIARKYFIPTRKQNEGVKLKDLHERSVRDASPLLRESSEPQAETIEARGMRWRRFPDSGKWMRWENDIDLGLVSATSNRDVIKASLTSTQFKKIVEAGYEKGKILNLEEKPGGSVFMRLKVGRKEVSFTINKSGVITQEE